ncbi:MAG TPA: 5-formyltetrahydrofolate cyclo-ligase [Nitrosomonas europaea]|mgnify:FL=1|uniref:5-formyltetrahydrofolate cyclo-ligase n=1 Tax=Nitrosomonas europaea TaxID=915 RepID=UPI0024917220|nr:5-formyltetrahydrofolate cyclo-ligase [Nitrosomonas europaea]HRN82526.1 5-formyltetrahydrofolate cyclo-ligase [Nitrosomonas europaea]HRO57187.1 5-formyltetrahydrofolate cyclo-ligase [Nitrosomonas europaea]HRQ09153.1 5-formyltetrahydrofolate cyclo-ligase [Nitrosomonas europaea]HUM74836.1 5-formyltetrahydrofolate cyclo-ligase [Nitrosomonas europaea]
MNNAALRHWKQQQRARLRELRQQVPVTQRMLWSDAITAVLTQGFPFLENQRIGFYWPHQGEYDPIPAMTFLRTRGATLALPEVISKDEPLRFIEWWPEAPMKKDIYGIPFPDNTRGITVDSIIIPLLGFDEQGYRLGYGSGYFDRTLAAMSPRPLAIGVAFEILRLPTIHPQQHDIPMDYIVTEQSILHRTDTGLVPLTTPIVQSETA